MNELTQEYLKECLSYNRETGVFTRKIKTCNTVNINDVAGCISKNNGYVEISLKNKNYRGHRLAWLYEHGYFPKYIDHINGIRSDNRIFNLREATQSKNMQNLKKAGKNNKSGYLGVYFSKKRNKFIAQIRMNGISKNLGGFDTAVDAYIKYIEVKRKVHEFNTL